MISARIGRIALTGALVSIAFAFAARFTAVSAAQLATPFDLLYETASYASIEVIAAGRNPFAPTVYAEPPFVLTMYTPLYHYLVAALPRYDTNVFYTGRVVSLVATLLAAAMIPIASGKKRWGVGIIGIGFFFALWPVSQWGTYVKSDMLALAFSALGVVAIQISSGRAWLLLLAAVFCVLAITCKQSYLAASTAGALFLLLRDRRSFAIFASSGAVLGVGLLGFASVHWGPGFWFSTVSSIGQEITLSHAMTIVSLSGPKPLIAVACCFAVGLAVKQWRREGVEVVKRAPYLLYAAVSVIFFAATVGKVGGSTNYLIEPWFALLMWMAFALRDVHAPLLEHPAALGASGVLALACVAALATDHDREYSWVDAASNTGRARHYARLREEVEALGFDNPSVLSFFVWDGEPDLRVFAQSKTYMITDHVNLNDAFLYELLWEAGALDIRAMVTAIEGQSFDLIITPKELRWARTRGALQPNYETLMAPVLAHYRLASTGEGHRYYVRRDGRAK